MNWKQNFNVLVNWGAWYEYSILSVKRKYCTAIAKIVIQPFPVSVDKPLVWQCLMYVLSVLLSFIKKLLYRLPTLENKPQIVCHEESVEQYMALFAFQPNLVMDNWLWDVTLGRTTKGQDNKCLCPQEIWCLRILKEI